MKKVILITLYFLSPVPLCVVLFIADPEKYSDIALLIGMILGATAYAWLIAEFVLISRVKFLEKEFGQDRFYRIHAVMAFLCLVLVLAHKIIEESALGEIPAGRFGDAAFILFCCVCVFALVFISDSFLMRFEPFFRFRKFCEKLYIAKYEYQVALHNIALPAIIVMYVHVTKTCSAQVSPYVNLAFFMYLAIGLCFYIYHKFIKLIFVIRNPYTVKEVISFSDDIKTLVLVPDNGKIFNYLPGQFGFFRIKGEGIKREEHPFTIVSHPMDKTRISITIKALGDYSSAIANVKTGYKAYIDAPYGRFSYLLHPEEKGIVFIVGGIGITPALSMLRYMHACDRNRPVILFWGVDYKRDLIMFDDAELLKKDMKNFHYIPVVFREDEWNGKKGIIDEEKIETIFKIGGLKIEETGFYFCGPAPMLRRVLHALKILKIKKSRIHLERFSI
ncbi:MAG: FAD-binding oxidoreductase [Spirochaetota bacterium]